MSESNTGGRPDSAATVKRAVSVLRFLGRNRAPVAATEIAQELGMTRSTVSRLANALVDEGFVQRDASNRYILGLLPIILGRAAIQQRPLQPVARPWLENLAHSTNESASLSVLYDGRIVYLDYIAPEESLDMGVTPGRTIAANTSAMGKVLLSGLADPDLERYLSTAELKGRTPRSIVSAAVLREQVLQARGNGIAIDDEETSLGTRCVAAPVLDAAGKTIAAISISGAAARLSYERLEQLQTEVRGCAEGISRDFGYTSEHEWMPGEATTVDT